MSGKPDVPTITIQSPNATFTITFHREAEACWHTSWPAFTGRGTEHYRSLEYLMRQIAEHIGRTEF
jgi:hypothetical protein